jgi:hypothetical protein
VWTAELAKPLLDHWRIGENPAVDRAMINFEAALAEHLFKIPVAGRTAKIPSHRLHDQPCLEVPPLKSSFDWRFSFSAMAFRIIDRLHKIWSGNICDKPD